MAGATWASAAAAALVAALALAAAGGVAAGGAFGGGGGDGFIRKYAMMKVYESCLGREVVRQVQQELRAACQRCNGDAGAPAPGPAPDEGQPAAAAASTAAPAPAPAAAPAAASSPSSTGSKRRKQPQPASVPFDPVKLQEAIMGFRQTASPPGGAVYPGAAPPAGYYPAPQAQPFGYYPGGYYPQAYPSAAAAYPGGYPAAAPVYPQPAPYYPGAYPGGYSSGGYYPVPATSGHRGSRDLDLRTQLESLTARMGARTRNATCVLQELGYLDESLEPNYAGIQEKLRELPVGEELRRDMLAGVDYCRQFAGCLPAQGPAGHDARRLFRSKFFFQCYKHKKLEACVMKDVREGYDRDDAELRSTAAAADPQDLQDVARDMFDFLSGASLAEESIY